MQQIFLMVQAMTNIVRRGAEEVRLEVKRRRLLIWLSLYSCQDGRRQAEGRMTAGDIGPGPGTELEVSCAKLRYNCRLHQPLTSGSSSEVVPFSHSKADSIYSVCRVESRFCLGCDYLFVCFYGKVDKKRYCLAF